MSDPQMSSSRHRDGEQVRSLGRAATARPVDSPSEDAHPCFDVAWELSGQLRDDPDIARLLAEARRPVRRDRRVWQAGLGVAASLLLAWGALWWNPPSPDTLALAVPVGEQRAEQLPDASRVVLNSGSRLVANFSESTRVVTLLAGEATFEVKRDGRPFEVHTPEGTTRVLGTRFNVRLADNGSAQVSVLEGRVEVASTRAPGGRHPVELTGGQAVSYDHRGLSAIEVADTDRILSWHGGRISFQEWPLTRVIEEYNRYTTNKVRVEGGDGILFSGSFTLENREELISTLESVYDVRIHPLPPGS